MLGASFFSYQQAAGLGLSVICFALRGRQILYQLSLRVSNFVILQDKIRVC